jgi:hypothetical protein
LVSGGLPQSEHFLQNSRKYNSLFQMTSLGVKMRNVEPTFTIQGQLHHRIGLLNPSPETSPAFLQLFFLDNAETQVDERMRILNQGNLNRGIVLQLTTNVPST